jgi:retinol-binding protein 3
LITTRTWLASVMLTAGLLSPSASLAAPPEASASAGTAPTAVSPAPATQPSRQGAAPSAQERTAILQKIGAVLDDYYVYPEVATKMAAHLRQRSEAGAYDRIPTAEGFARALTRDLREVSHDLHLGITYDPKGGSGRAEEELTPEQRAQQDAEFRRFGQRHNWGIEKLEILPGNIGYMKLRAFFHPDWSGETLATAMAFLARTDALIIDERENFGGYPQTVALLLSYLVAPPSIHGGIDAVHLLDMVDRREKTTTQLWTSLFVPGKRYLDQPVTLLIGKRTVSAGEMFATLAKTLKRATLVGTTTPGAAHNVMTRPINDHFAIDVSFGYNRIVGTGGDWEGKGVAPDVAVSEKTALESAHLALLQERLRQAKSADEKQQYQTLVRDAERALAAAQPKPPLAGKVTFRLRGHTEAREVLLAGDFTRWGQNPIPMVKETEGWLARLDLDPGKHQYKFVVDNEWILDPDNPQQETDPEGYVNSVRTVPN